MKRVDERVAVAGSFGWTAGRGSSKVNGAGRPSVSDGIVCAAGTDAGSRVGDLPYCRIAATHTSPGSDCRAPLSSLAQRLTLDTAPAWSLGGRIVLESVQSASTC